jgi:hypothetical protein
MTARREWQEDKRSTSPSSYLAVDRNSTVQPTRDTASQISAAKENQRLHLHATRMILEENKDSIKKSIDEATLEISRYTQALKDYQEQTCQDTKEIVDSYLETLNEIIISFQSDLDPYIRTNDDGINYFYQWVAPRLAAQTYRNTIYNIANNMLVTTRLANSMIFANMEAFMVSTRKAKDNAKEFARIAVNARS